MAIHGIGRITRALGLSHWTALAAGIVIFVLHVCWLIRVSPDHRLEVVSGFGAMLIVLGIWVAALLFLRKGLKKTAADSMPPLVGSFATPPEYDESREGQRPQARRDVTDERVLGVAAIAIGTILNGYAAPVARTLESIPRLFAPH